MIKVRDVTKVFNSGRPNEFAALRGVSLTINFHEVTAIKGPSGSGKSTLLGMIGCMARPSSGRIFVGDREITSLPERFLTDVRRRTFGFIFQQFNLIRGMTVLENVMAPAYPTGERFSVLRERAMASLETLNMAHKASSKVESLSGGEAQRAAIARALINDPPVIIADEPTAHLDTRLSHELMDIMCRLKGEGRTVIVASHDPIVFEAKLADRVIEIRDGRFLTEGEE